MTEERIIKYWREGYSIEQITDMSETVQRLKKLKADDSVRNMIKNRVERTILQYQSQD